LQLLSFSFILFATSVVGELRKVGCYTGALVLLGLWGRSSPLCGSLWFEKEAEKRRQKRAEELIAVKH
jgi:hypothetical protein